MDQFDPRQVVLKQVFPPVDFNCVCCCKSRWLPLGNRCANVYQKSCVLVKS